MLSDELIKLIIESLDGQFEMKRQEYEIAKEHIQELCNHTKTENEVCGKLCCICGKWIEVY